jgi:hypothetical protein
MRTFTCDIETIKGCFLLCAYVPEQDTWHDFFINESQNDLYPMIKEITEKFEDELTEVLDSRLDPPTLVIKFRRLTKLISKEVFEEEGTPFNYRASK